MSLCFYDKCDSFVFQLFPYHDTTSIPPFSTFRFYTDRVGKHVFFSLSSY